jgi:hypothetical protein
LGRIAALFRGGGTGGPARILIDSQVKVAFVSAGRARPMPKPLRLAMRADHDAALVPRPGAVTQG